MLEAIRLRLEKRKASYASLFSCLQALVQATPRADVLAALGREADEDPNDLAALDAAWEEEEVTFGAARAAQCGKDGIAAKVRAARRPAPGMPVAEPRRPVVTHSLATRA